MLNKSIATMICLLIAFMPIPVVNESRETLIARSIMEIIFKEIKSFVSFVSM